MILDMENCVFCKIAAGTLPSHKVYEDERFLAFIDIHPHAPGHVQVIPKEHHRWVWDVPQIGDYFEVARKIALAQRKAFGTDWVLSKIVGDEVEHAHIWVFPNKNVKADANDFAGNAAKIREAM